MITSAKQLKDKIKNLSGGNGTKAQTLLRNFIMERFLERISVSEYKDRMILKGGMLVASIVGLDTRTTMDIDTTVTSLPLTLPEAKNIVEKIAGIDLGDGVTFAVKSVSDIMEDHDYPGLRFMLDAHFDGLRQPIKIDISTGDTITPAAISYNYKLMLEERSICILSYNLETLLAEKLETVMARGLANTRMRDFYDIHVLLQEHENEIDYPLLKQAFLKTSEKRNSTKYIGQIQETLFDVLRSEAMKNGWNTYAEKSFFVSDMKWETICNSVLLLAEKVTE